MAVLLLVTVAFAAYRYRDADADPVIGTGPDEGRSPTSTDEESTTPALDLELLSNEEQVLQLIERNGGRMKQRAVADELGWTDAKTSQITKELREKGALEGFRLGRENVLALPGEDGDEAGNGVGDDG